MIYSILQKTILTILLITNLLFSPNNASKMAWLNHDTGNEYKAITYNIHRGTTKFGIPSLDQIMAILKNENADFIALQEVDRYHIRSGFKDQIKWLGEQLNMEYIFGSNLHFAFTEYGNAILSKYPIIDWGQLELTHESESRSLLWAKVKVDDQFLYITSIHLGLDRENRSENFALIENFIKEINDPTLLMGDFNVLPNHQGFSHFRARVSGKLINEEIPTYIKNKPVQIDYIFGNGITEIGVYNIPSNASDHYPLILRFKIRDMSHPDYQTVVI